MKNTCQISIAGVTLSVNTEYDAAYVGALADRVNQTLAALLHDAPGCTKIQAALLCLLDQFDQREKAAAELSALHKQLETDKLDLEILRIENEKLSGKLILFPAMVETYAILGLVVSILLLSL